MTTQTTTTEQAQAQAQREAMRRRVSARITKDANVEQEQPTLLTRGSYLGRIIHSEMKRSQTSNQPMLAIEVRPFAFDDLNFRPDRRLWQNYSFHGGAVRYTNQFLDEAGFDLAEFEAGKEFTQEDADLLLGRVVLIHVYDRPWGTGRVNDCSGLSVTAECIEREEAEVQSVY